MLGMKNSKKIGELTTIELKKELMDRLRFEMMCVFNNELKMLIFNNQDNPEELLVNNYETLRELLLDEVNRVSENPLPGWEDYAEGQARVFKRCVEALDVINEVA